MAQVSRFPLLAPTKSRSPLISSGSRIFTSLRPARAKTNKQTLQNHKHWRDLDFLFHYHCKMTWEASVRTNPSWGMCRCSAGWRKLSRCWWPLVASRSWGLNSQRGPPARAARIVAHLISDQDDFNFRNRRTESWHMQTLPFNIIVFVVHLSVHNRMLSVEDRFPGRRDEDVTDFHFCNSLMT